MKDYRHAPRRLGPEVMKEEALQLPAELNDQTIASFLRNVSATNPEKLPGTVQAIRQAWAHKMGGWVERGRLDYLNTLLQQFRVSGEILAQCLEMEDRYMGHQAKKAHMQEEINLGIPRLSAEAKAEELRSRIEASRAQQAEHRSRRDGFENPPATKREPTEDDRRQEKFKTAANKIARLQSRMREHLDELLAGRRFEQLSPEEQDEYRADENMYKDRIRQAKEERMQFE